MSRSVWGAASEVPNGYNPERGRSTDHTSRVRAAGGAPGPRGAVQRRAANRPDRIGGGSPALAGGHVYPHTDLDDGADLHRDRHADEHRNADQRPDIRAGHAVRHPCD